CILLNNKNLELLNTKGRILTALERYAEAEDLYKKVLSVEIYNVGAQSGLAELRIVAGDLKGSLYDFEKILKFSPDSRRLLLTLVVLYDSQKDFENSGSLIQKAIRNYPLDPVVLEAAVRHYINTKNYNAASLYMDELLNISLNSRIILLNAELKILLKEYSQSLEVLTEYMKEVKDNPESYYTAAVILWKTGEEEKALSLIKRAISLKPDEEIYRFYSEMIMDDIYNLKDSNRSEYSSWYYNQGKLYESKYFYNKAEEFYQRGLDLDPFSFELRYAIAKIYKKLGYREKYINQLNLILQESPENKEVLDILTIEKSLPLKPIYQEWGSENFDDRDYFLLSIYVNSPEKSEHIYSNEIVKSIAGRFLSDGIKFNINDIANYDGRFSTAFNNARDSGSDYFLVVDFIEGSRTFSLHTDLFLTRSGRKLNTFSYLKTGNDRVFNCFENLSSDLDDFIPVLGSVRSIKANQISVNIGQIHKVSVDDEFKIVKKGNYKLVPDQPYILYNQEDVIGSFKVKDIGEYMCSGEYESNSAFNLINEGDNIILLDSANNNPTLLDSKTITDKELINQLLLVN
ncbi:MAG: hypothetical protein JXR64_09355, partial [Spirochaetales bacterium]|nr:hypothetical protein [Spirochaetales bacterium]